MPKSGRVGVKAIYYFTSFLPEGGEGGGVKYRTTDFRIFFAIVKLFSVAAMCVPNCAQVVFNSM